MLIINKKAFKKLRYLLETIFVYIFYYFFKLLPIDFASWLGGSLGKIIGPYLKVSNLARNNIKNCFPQFSERKVQKTLTSMWDNLGRIIAEFPHWADISAEEFHKRVKINSPKIINKSLLLSGHLGNFELAVSICKKLNENVKLVYRPANNPYVNKLIVKVREKNNLNLLPKGKAGLKQILDALHDKSVIGMLIDQKLNDGIVLPFFNMPAKTTNLPAKLAIKFKIPIYMLRVKRLKGAHYEVNVIKLKSFKNIDSLSLTKKMNEILEGWITEFPEQWFWVHKRWG